MKTINLFILLCMGMHCFSQPNLSKHTQEKFTSFTGGLSLNVRLFGYFEQHIKWENYDTLCVRSTLFVKFEAGNKMVSAIKFSDDELPFLNAVIEKALLSTAPYWQAKSKEVYLLPVEYIFQKEFLTTRTVTPNSLQMLQKFSGEQRKYTIPGGEDYTPLKCVLLNPYFITTRW